MKILFIWDFDGVIANTPHEEAWFKACEFYGIRGFDHKFYNENVSGFTSYEGSKNILEKLEFFKEKRVDVEQTIKEFSNFKTKIYLKLLDEGKYSLNLSVLTFVLEARKGGIIQALASASDNKLIKILFEKSNLNFYEFFDIDVSGAGNTKDEIFRNALNEALKKFRRIDKVFVFEDSINGVKAGISLGFVVIGCFNKELKNHGARIVVEDFRNFNIESILVEE